MDTVRDCPAEILRAIAAKAPEDKPLYWATADLTSSGHYQDGWLVATPTAVHLVIDGRLSDTVERTDAVRFEARVMTGSGVFLVTGAHENRALSWFSRGHALDHQRLAAVLGASPPPTTRDQSAATDGLLPVQRGGFARDWVVEPLRNPRATLGRLLKFLKPHSGALALALGLFAVANLLTLLIPQLMRILIDDWLVHRAFEPVPVLGLLGAMAGTYILHALVVIGRNRTVARLSADLIHDLRQAVFASLQRMPLRYIADKPPGDVLNRVAVDTANLRQFLQRWGTDGVSQIGLFVLLCVITFSQDWRLALLTVSTMPLVVLMALAVWRIARWMERTHHRLHDRIGSLVHDTLAGIRVVKAFRQEPAEVARYRDWTARKYVIDVRNQKIWRTMGPSIDFGLRLGELFVLLAGGALVLAGELQLGELVQFAAYVVLLVEPMAWMGQMPQRLVEALTSAERIFEAMDQKDDLPVPPNPEQLDVQGRVSFEGVGFAYRPGEPVLDGFTLDIAPGEMIGLVGASGAGKSTVANLLLRLYDVSTGRITVDGVDLRELDPEVHRRHMGVVLQDPFLFSGTIAENIGYALSDASRADIVAAAGIAQAHDFITAFPDGYDTLVGERGQRLSGGERQRISIARAVLHNPRILILDEATSALDLETEARIHAALAALTEGRTVIAIAHRLATLSRADRLVVLDRGRILETGTHRELMEARGRYWAMVEAQRILAESRTLSAIQNS